MVNLSEFYVAYIPNEKNYKFLCKYEKGEKYPKILIDFKPERKSYIGCYVANVGRYVIRKATEEDLDKAMVNMI